MRRFFHRKGSQARLNSLTSNGGIGNRLRNNSSSISPSHDPTTGQKRARAPALRSRSMSVLYTSEAETATGAKSKRFLASRSLSFSDDHQNVTSNQSRYKLLTQSEEDEFFKLYTKKLYLMFAILSAIITGFVVYAYMYNTGSIKET